MLFNLEYFLYEKELIMPNLCLRLDSCREYSNYTSIWVLRPVGLGLHINMYVRWSAHNRNTWWWWLWFVGTSDHASVGLAVFVINVVIPNIVFVMHKIYY